MSAKSQEDELSSMREDSDVTTECRSVIDRVVELVTFQF